MSQVTIEIDAITEQRLHILTQTDAESVPEVASRLLRRAVLLARPRRKFDTEDMRLANLEFAAEDEALAESASAERVHLLELEDKA